MRHSHEVAIIPDADIPDAVAWLAGSDLTALKSNTTGTRLYSKCINFNVNSESDRRAKGDSDCVAATLLPALYYQHLRSKTQILGRVSEGYDSLQSEIWFLFISNIT